MSTSVGQMSGLSMIIKRALEGRISPLNFMLSLGFFSSLVLLYISLHVYFFAMSKDIGESREKLDMIMDRNVRLTAAYNELISPERIIPIAERFGMRAGSPGEVRRLALYEDKKFLKRKTPAVARSGTAGTQDGAARTQPGTVNTQGGMQEINPESR